MNRKCPNSSLGSTQVHWTVEMTFPHALHGCSVISLELLRSPMKQYNIGEYYAVEALDAATAKYVYSNTIPGSKLRNFVCDSIKVEGPFAAETTEDWERDDIQMFHTEWVSLLGEGGDIVTDNIKTGFSRYSTKKSPPWSNKRISRYLVGEAPADPEGAKASAQREDEG